MQSNSDPPPDGFVENTRSSIKEYVEGGKNESEKGTRFLQWVLTRVFEATEDDATNAIIDGPNDRGIDAYLPVEFSEDTVRLFQSKYGTSHSLEAIAKFKEDAKRLLSMNVSSMKPELAQLVTKIHKNKNNIKYCYVTNQDVNYEGDAIEIVGESQIMQKLWDRRMGPPKDKEAKIIMEGMFKHGNATIFGVMRLAKLKEFVDNTKDYVFESNIRHWMRFKTSVNKGLRKTLEEDPNKFLYYNNGITIVTSDFKIDNCTISDSDACEYCVTLDSPQIVNGAQTSNAILNSVMDDKNPGFITVTVIKANREEQNNITKYRNSQNAIRGKDLVSLTEFHKSIHAQFEEYGYFYEIQAGSFDAMKKSERLDYKGDPTYNMYLPEGHNMVIVAKDAIQALVAGIEQTPTKAYSTLAQFLPGGRRYDDVFNDDLKDDYKLLLYPYLVKEYAKKSFGYGKYKGHRTKRYATLFFVAVYFRMLHGSIMGNSGGMRGDIQAMEPLFRNIKLNTCILKLADVIVTKFLEDTAVDDEMKQANSWHNFFSRHVWNDSMLRVIDTKISKEEDKIADLRSLASSHSTE